MLSFLIELSATSRTKKRFRRMKANQSANFVRGSSCTSNRMSTKNHFFCTAHLLNHKWVEYQWRMSRNICLTTCLRFTSKKTTKTIQVRSIKHLRQNLIKKSTKNRLRIYLKTSQTYKRLARPSSKRGFQLLLSKRKKRKILLCSQWEIPRRLKTRLMWLKTLRSNPLTKWTEFRAWIQSKRLEWATLEWATP